MTSQSSLAVIFFLIYTTTAAPNINGNLSMSDISSIEANGFTYLGNLQANPNQPRWSYFLSKDKVIINDALGLCLSMFNGRLLTIFTREEDEYIRLRLQMEGLGELTEYVATAGKWNPLTVDWEWSTTGGPFIYKNFQGTDPIGAAGTCIAVVGELSSYQWKDINCGGDAYYICQF